MRQLRIEEGIALVNSCETAPCEYLPNGRGNGKSFGKPFGQVPINGPDGYFFAVLFEIVIHEGSFKLK